VTFPNTGTGDPPLPRMSRRGRRPSSCSRAVA
jgi:hypothetical protein